MYKCGKCGMGVLVKDLPLPIRACNCKVSIERKPVTILEKVKSFFGKKFYTEKLAPIVTDIAGTAYGRSQFNG
jgi:hypothetical protein